ncbi:uncharacterized protein [Argopecten irradians]|uniref:uncharacterized protein n=1 Tax=Argopecten irradians TaxID=31199 RepID=UPI0037240F9C
MGILKQLGQLLWKNIILRRREPHILLLEILWPLIIFGIVAVVRHGTPGNKKTTCSYADRALPSAGMLPFIQTTVCNLQNPCDAQEMVQQRQASAARLTSMVSDLQPYLTAETSVQALETLETSVKVVKGISSLMGPGTNTSDGNVQSGLLSALGNDTFTVKNLLKDTAKVKHVLVDEMKIMTPEVADAFLNAQVNVLAIFQSIGGIDLRYIVCNEEELKKYMIFGENTNVTLIKDELCAIDVDKIPAITDMVQSQLDIAAIIRAAKSLTSLTQTYELGDALEDIASMVDIVSGTSSFGSLFASSSMLQDLPSLLNKLPGILDIASQVESFESSSIDELLVFLDPIIRSFAPNFTEWQSIIGVVDQVKSAADTLTSGGELNFTALLSGFGNLSSIGNMLNIDPNVTALLQMVSQSGDLSGPIQASLEGQPMDLRSLEQSLDGVQMMMEEMFGKDSTDQMFCTVDSGLDIITTMVKYAEGVKPELDMTFGLLLINMNTLAKTYQASSYDIYAIGSTLIHPKVITEMLHDPSNFSMICQRALDESVYYMEAQMKQYAKDMVCQTTFASQFAKLSDAIKVSSIEKEMDDAFRKLSMGLGAYNCTPGARLTVMELYPAMMNLSTRISALETPTYMWEAYNVDMVIDMGPADWVKVQNAAGEAIFNTVWEPMVMMMGPMLEETPVWSVAGPMLYNMYQQMDSMMTQMEFTEKMMDPTSDTGKLMKYVIEYLPEIMTTMMNPNSSLMLTEVMNSSDPMKAMCDQHTLQKMGMPDSVPVVEIETAMCNINWTEVMVGMAAAFDVESMMQQMANYFDPNTTVQVPDTFDWDGMVTNMNKMQKMMSGEMIIMNVLMTINFTRLEEAMANMMTTSLPDMSGMIGMDPSSMNMNMTWEGLVSALTGMGDLNNGLEQADMINMLLGMLLPGNSSDMMHEVQTMQAVYTNQMHTTLQFIIKHLTYFNNTDTIDLRAYLGSVEFNKILDNMATGPEMNAVILETVHAMMTDTDKVNYLMNNLEQLCSNRTVFEGIFKVPAGNSLDFGQVFSSICEFDVNITKMFEELIENVDGLSDVVTMYMSPPPGLEAVNYTTIMEEQELLNSLMESLFMHSPTITIGGSMQWMNLTIYLVQLEDFMGKLSTAFNMDNLSQLPSQSVDSAFSSLQAIPEMESMLQMISFYVKIAKERLTQSIDASEDPLASLKGFPTLQNLMTMADDIPHLYAVLVFNSIFHPSKFTAVLMSSSWEEFCNQTDLPVDVPGSNFNMSAFHTDLCALNLTALEAEAAEYQAVSYGLLNYTVNVTDTVVNITQLSEQVTEMFTLLITIENSTTEEEMVLPQFLNWTVWEHVNSHLITVITDPNRLMNIQNSADFLQSLLAQPGMEEELRTQSIIYGILGVFMDKLDNLSNKTVLNFAEILANDTETLKLWNLLNTPGVLEILMFSANSQQFTEFLTMENATEALLKICDPNTNLSALFTVPSGVQVDLHQLQMDFCGVKLDLLEQEFMEEIMEVINKYMDNSTELSWTDITAQNLRLTQWIELWSVNAPTLDLPSLANLQAMLEQQYGQEMVDWSWTNMFGQTIGPISDPDLAKAIATVNLILEVVNGRLDHLTDSVSLNTLLMNDTDVEKMLQAYLNIVQYSTDLLSPDSDLHVERLLQLIENGSVLMSMCESSSLDTYLSKTGQASNLTISIQTALCMNPEVFLQDLQAQAEAAYIETQLMRIWNSSEPLSVSWNDLNSNVENMTRLLTSLLQQEPMVDMGAWNMFGNFSMLIKSFEEILQDPNMLLEMSSSVNPLMSMEIESDLAPFLDVWHQLYSNMHMMISSVQDGKPVNSSVILGLLNSLSSLETDYGKAFEELAQHADVQAVVCDMTTLSGWFPLEATQLSSAVCGFPSNRWLDRIQQEFGTNSTVPSRLLKMIETMFPQHFTTDVTWGELFDQVQNLTETAMTLTGNHTEILMEAILGALGGMTQSDEAIDSSMDWLNMLGDGSSVMSAQGLLNFLTEVNKYLNRQMQQLKDQGNNIPLAVLLPNSTLLADLLEQLNHETAAGLLTAYINPDQFLELTLTDRWLTAVCNMTLFEQTFIFPNGTNTQLIQQDLCADAQSQQSIIREILQKLNIADVLNSFDDWIMGKTPAVAMNNTYVSQAIQQNIEMLMTTIGKLSNLTLSTNNFDQWLAPIMTALDTLSRPNPDSLYDTSNSNVDISTIMLGILNNMDMTTKQMAIQSIVEDSLCDLASWNISSLTRRIQETNLTQLIISLESPVLDVSGKFQCSAMVTASNELAIMWNESVARMSASNTLYECLLGSLEAPLHLLSDATKTFSVVMDVLGLLNDPAILALDDSGDLVSLIDFMYNVFLQQQNVSVRLVDILTNDESFEMNLRDILDTSPEVMSQLLNSTINADGLALLNQSADDLAKTLCDPDELSKVLTLPEFSNVSMVELSNVLCGPNISLTTEVFTSMLDISTISFLLLDDVSDLNMWSVLSAHIADVINKVQQLTTLPDIDIDLNNLNTLLPYLQRFIYNYGPEALVSSLNVVVEDLKYLVSDDDAAALALMSDAQTVMLGITSLKVIRNFIPLNIVLQDVLKDADSFKQFMINDLGLSPEISDAVLMGAIDYSVLLRYHYAELEKQVCDPALLSGILNLTTSSGVQISQISDALCNLNDAQIVNLTESLLQNLDVGELVKQYVISGVDGLFNSLNVTAGEISDSLAKLSAAEEGLTSAANIYKNKSADLNLNIFTSPEALSGSSLPSLSNVLCGDNSDSLSFSDTLGVSNKVDASSQLTEGQQKEREELAASVGESNEEGFCQDLYVDIITSQYGPVIWTYLKPLIRGKILYSPNTPTTQQLAQMMSNSSFGILEDVQHYSRLWAKGLMDINELKSDPNVMANIEVRSK